MIFIFVLWILFWIMIRLVVVFKRKYKGISFIGGRIIIRDVIMIVDKVNLENFCIMLVVKIVVVLN